MTSRPPLIGLALGSGAARGWGHIGVLRVLEREGISPTIVCGTSIGALVGAAYAAGQLERMHTWVNTLNWKEVIGLIDLKMGGGLIKGDKLVDFFNKQFHDEGIARLEKKFACVATDLASGEEVWLREGKVSDAVRASIALPGLFTPQMRDGRLLVDGGLVNPIPISLCRAMGAQIVIAVDLNWNLVGRRNRITGKVVSHWNPLMAMISSDFPSMLDVIATSLNIMQIQISNARSTHEPADIMIRPELCDIAAMDFHRGALAIKAGEQAAQDMLPNIHSLIASTS